MIRFDIATALLQWSAGGLFYLWITTRRREVGIGYGWLMRATYGSIGVLALVVGRRYQPSGIRDLLVAAMLVAVGVALAQSVLRRKAGVEGERDLEGDRKARVVQMTGIERATTVRSDDVPEFDPRLDLIPPLIGLLALVAAGFDSGGSSGLAVIRNVSAAALLGAVSDAMLLGHWYLVQPGLPRGPLLELVRHTAIAWPVDVIAMLLPTGMLSVIAGTIDDGYGGILGWTWATCAVTTIGLVAVTRAALRERQYSAVMAATGLLYLAILTGFGQVFISRAVLG